MAAVFVMLLMMRIAVMPASLLILLLPGHKSCHRSDRLSAARLQHASKDAGLGQRGRHVLVKCSNITSCRGGAHLRRTRLDMQVRLPSPQVRLSCALMLYGSLLARCVFALLKSVEYTSGRFSMGTYRHGNLHGKRAASDVRHIRQLALLIASWPSSQRSCTDEDVADSMSCATQAAAGLCHTGFDADTWASASRLMTIQLRVAWAGQNIAMLRTYAALRRRGRRAVVT